MAAWFASLYTLDGLTDEGNVQWPLFVGYSIAAGLLAGRWWVVGVPFVAINGLLVWDYLDPCEDCRNEISLLGAFLLGTVYAAGTALLIAAGVGIRKGIGLLRSRGGA